MSRHFLRSKIHRAVVTDKSIDYEGSITLDTRLMEAAGILPYEQVHVLNVTTGARFETYAIRGRSGSGQVCVNGAAARLAEKGDIVIVMTYESRTTPPSPAYRPTVVKVNARNRIVKVLKGS
jgi:aspartate 1-decarboxylase